MEDFGGHIFYSFGILILISVILSLFRFNRLYRTREWFSKFKQITGKEATVSDFRSKKDHTYYINHNALVMFELLWVLIGCLVGISIGNWFMFLSVIVIGLSLNLIFSKIKFTLIGKIISFNFLLYRLLLYLFLIGNHFYFKIDVWDWITKAF